MSRRTLPLVAAAVGATLVGVVLAAPVSAQTPVAVAAPAGAQTPAPVAPPPDAAQDHVGHVHPPGDTQSPVHDHGGGRSPAAGGPAIPPITDADRAAAFPDVHGHALHDNDIHSFVLLDQLEWRPQDAGAYAWNGKGWIGRDLDRVWFRTEGQGERGDVDDAEVQVFYGRAISRWFEALGGVRQDLRPGPGITWAAVGVQGLAPYWFEVEATAFVGTGGRTALRLEAEYELLLTNRLILQPRVELDLHGRTDAARGIGAGLSTAETGLRLRYEIRREIAPYLGVSWDRRFGETADLAKARGDKPGAARLVIGLRTWF
ncbi:MAG: copper resistance protein B [Vicinamibacterales bacterium]